VIITNAPLRRFTDYFLFSQFLRMLDQLVWETKFYIKEESSVLFRNLFSIMTCGIECWRDDNK